jgi:hypothetical protein
MMAAMLTLILTGLLRAVRTQRALALENLALRHQLTVLHRTALRPRLRPSDRLFWVLLSRLWHGWAEALAIVHPETVIRWQRAGFRLVFVLFDQRLISSRGVSRQPHGCDPRLEQQENPSPLPEELVEALAALLAEALVNDIRQYPDLRDLPCAGAPVATRGSDSSPRPSARHPRTSTRSRTRRPAHAS